MLVIHTGTLQNHYEDFLLGKPKYTEPCCTNFLSKLFLARVNYSPKGHAKLLGVKNYVLEAYCKMEKCPCFTVRLLIINLIIYIT